VLTSFAENESNLSKGFDCTEEAKKESKFAYSSNGFEGGRVGCDVECGEEGVGDEGGD